MPAASYAVPGFLGGEISQFAQGRFDAPAYKISLNVCLNAFPTEIGAWTPRPGTAYAGHTRGGNPGAVKRWDFNQSTPYTLEFTDGHVRFRVGTTIATNNDSQSVTSISAANPAVVTVSGNAPATGSTVMFGNLGATCPTLQNRQFTFTNTGTHTGTITDAITGVNIDGSTLGPGPAAAATMASIQDITSPYVSGAWGTLRLVQADSVAFALQSQNTPQAVTIATQPTAGASAIFALAAANFEDGPYLDPFTNGVQANPNQTTGVVKITLSFPAYVATTSYAIGDFVTSSSVNYESLIDQNVGNTPASSPSAWNPVSAGAAINNGQGFLGTDVGRFVRFFSEPAAWAVGTTYSAGTVVSYNPTNVPGASTYWQSLTGSNVGHIPGADLTNWELVAPGATLPAVNGISSTAAAAGPAQWTWGKIVSLANLISGSLSGSLNIGTLTGNGGLAAAFNGTVSQVSTACAALATSSSSLNAYIGKNYSGASAQAINSVTVVPSTDDGFAVSGRGQGGGGGISSVVLNLRAKASSPSSPSDGTLLGTSGNVGNTVSPVSINSSDAVTTWNYVWVEIIVNWNRPVSGNEIFVSQVEFYNPPGTGTGNAVNVELLGPALLYTTPIITWRLGAYSNTTGFPTCGCYAGGRLWLGGVQPGKFDASTTDDITNGTVNFAPTDQYGGVNNNNGISYTFKADGTNPIFWMKPIVQNQALRGIVMGTQAREWFVFPPTSGPLTATNIDAIPATKNGCANVLPVETEHTTVFVQRYSVKLLEYFSDVFSGKFTAPNLADQAQHIPRSGIVELAYTHATTPIIWGRGNDGSLFGLTYKRDTLMTAQGPTYKGWHRHQLGSGRTVTSLSDGPSTGGNLDALTMVTNDAATGIYHVEVLTDQLDELTPLAQSWFVDDGIVPTSTVSTNTPSLPTYPYGSLTLNGLWAHNGKTISVFAGGLDCGDFTVSNGSVIVPYGDSISWGPGGGLFTAAFAAGLPANQIIAGFTYNSDGQLVRPQTPPEVGTRNGPALGKRRRFHKVAMLLNNLAMGNTRNQSALSIGRDFNHLSPVIIAPETVPNQARLTPGQSFSGVWKDTVQGDSDYDGMVAWRISRPLPGNIAAIEPLLEGQDE